MGFHDTMIDPFGRAISYLRVSVTDRCDFRCTYCMAEDMAFLPKKDLLSLEELDRLCTVFIEKGVRKLRLTGGEVSSSRIGVAVLDRLRVLDEVAYLRFASVYKNFDAAADFQSELELLSKLGERPSV